MYQYFRRAVSDMLSNRFLNFVTIVTIALSILVVSTFVLFFENVNRVIDSWHRGFRVVAYLDQGFVPSMVPELMARVQAMGNTTDVRFIPKEEALKSLKDAMTTTSAFFDTLEENPLPHALEITINAEVLEWSGIAAFAGAVDGLPHVDSVEYGERWLGRFLTFLTVFKIIGFAMGSLFFMIALFITANTVRLVLYSRRTEVEIMRLVGATDRFIVTPFYIQGLIQGVLGGLAGLLILSAVFFVISSNLGRSVAPEMMFSLQFLSVKYWLIIIASSAFLGWLGCCLSLKQFLKY
ncbi:MAG: permease-like cell division protein FtsX [Desulfobacterium sp.]|nr:permease-like cell division protein FtsX [Desulfobacterium sp.]